MNSRSGKRSVVSTRPFFLNCADRELRVTPLWRSSVSIRCQFGSGRQRGRPCQPPSRAFDTGSEGRLGGSYGPLGSSAARFGMIGNY